jgi:hydrogenase maturation protease
MSSIHIPNTCIVGIGNTLRSDDGVGAYVCETLAKQSITGVHIITSLQLDTNMIEELIGFDQVIFVDAAIDTAEVTLQQITKEHTSPQSFSHHINAAMLARLAEQLYEAKTKFYICAVPGFNFELGNTISKQAKKNATKAVAFVQARITSNH